MLRLLIQYTGSQCKPAFTLAGFPCCRGLETKNYNPQMSLQLEFQVGVRPHLSNACETDLEAGSETEAAHLLLLIFLEALTEVQVQCPLASWVLRGRSGERVLSFLLSFSLLLPLLSPSLPSLPPSFLSFAQHRPGRHGAALGPTAAVRASQLSVF